MISNLRNWLSGVIATAGHAFNSGRVVFRDLSRQRSAPSSVYTSKRVDERRFAPQADILAARRLWARDGYAAQLVGNVIDFVAGGGAEVLWESDKWRDALVNWQWNPPNPSDGFDELARTLVRAIIRDGNILQTKNYGTRGPYLRQLNPGWMREATFGNSGYAGVQTDDNGYPLRYHYQPRRRIGRPYDSVISADRILHTFNSEWEDQLLGETWLRRSIDPLTLLDQTDALMVGSVQRAARVPLVFELPLEYAYEYSRAVDSDGNPVDPQEPDDEQQRQQSQEEAAINVLRQTMLAGPLDHTVIPSSIKANFNPYRAVVSMDARFLLLQRAAEGMGISMGTMLGDHGRGRLYSGMLDMAADKKFFEHTWGLAESHLRKVLDWWIQIMRQADPALTFEDASYDIVKPAFPIPDIRADAIAMKTLVEAHIVSPQTWAARYGYDAEAELEKWRRWMSLIGGLTNDDGSGASRTA